MQTFWKTVTAFLGAILGIWLGQFLALLLGVGSKIPLLIFMMLGASLFSVLFSSSYLFLMHGKTVKGKYQTKHIATCVGLAILSLIALYELVGPFFNAIKSYA